MLCRLQTLPRCMPVALRATSVTQLHVKNALEPDMEIRRHQAIGAYLSAVQQKQRISQENTEHARQSMDWWYGLEDVLDSAEAIRSFHNDTVAVGKDSTQAINDMSEFDAENDRAERTVCGGWPTPSPKERQEASR